VSTKDHRDVREAAGAATAGIGGGWIPALALLATAVCVVLLAATGFFATLSGTPLSGWGLLGHVGVGGAFAAALTLLAICRTGDFDTSLDGVRVRAAGNTALGSLFFWIMVASGMCLILSSGLMMLPQFGTVGQEMLLKWHRTIAIVAVAASILYCMVALANRRRS
jgi:hypothetical protein